MTIISLVSYPFLPAKTGGQKGIAIFYKYFSRHQDLTIVTTRKNDPAYASGYDLQPLLSNSKLRYINPFLFFSIRKLIHQKRATHLILEHPYYGWLGYLLKKFCSVKLVVHSHNIEGNRWRSLGKWWWPILWQYEKFTHRHADFNFFIQDEDRMYAIQSFGLKPEKCITISFGTELNGPPDSARRHAASLKLHELTGVPTGTSLLVINGAFRYTPNQIALDDLLTKINPLLPKLGFPYRILILGMDIPEKFLNGNFPNVQIIGFADDLELYLTGSDVFLNPVSMGGGIKTKLVEALAYNLTSVSTENGAIGVDPAICNGKLFVCKDGDWTKFADTISMAIKINSNIPPEFYDHFYWENITKKAGSFIAGIQ